ncbi:MAG: PaaI family thioesterase [Pseudomonadota bacterium]
MTDPEHDVAEHLENVPHSKAIGMKYIEHTDDHCTLALKYAPHLVGDPDTGVIHGGAITALLDNAAGLIARPKEMHRDVAAIATLDMRIDYMGPATPGQDVYARAHCFKRTTNVAFVRAVAYTHSPEDPIATATATFMLGTRNTPIPQDKAGTA